ncbi:MAG: type VI secretion system tube protein Hcp [Gammaproteobacteria bacterium]|nr:type VI secretion system tube protein Hcp [Gammaproteobacteria bacterium]
MAYTGIIIIPTGSRTLQIPVQSFHWSVSNAGGTDGAADARVLVQDFSFVKQADDASPALLLLCCSGAPLADVQFTVQGSAARRGPTLRYTFRDCRISGFRPGGSPEAGDALPLEEVSLRFAQCELDYWAGEAGPDTPPGDAHAGWNIPRNAPA